MASPFPGMDPYLEGEFWSEFHTTLANEIRNQLQPQLRPDYVALLEKRFAIQYPALTIAHPPPKPTHIRPDVAVVERQTTAASYGEINWTEPSAEIENEMPFDIPITSIAIRDTQKRRLVTVIEILSPANKIGQGAWEYLEKRNNILNTNTHLLEIDLLRRGHRIPHVSPLPVGDYYIFLNRLQKRPYSTVWAIQLPERLPTVPVPLLPPDADVPLDLQAALNACFERVEYETLLDYTQSPPPPMMDADSAEWVAQQIADAGLA